MRANICNRCSVDLTKDNWMPSAEKRRWLICSPCATKRINEYNKNNPDVLFKKNMTRRYGLLYKDYLSMLEKQNHVCAICNEPEKSKSKKNLSVDHCHTTGKVRGLLCSSCNVGLGKFKDRPDLLEKAGKYLCNVK